MWGGGNAITTGNDRLLGNLFAFAGTSSGTQCTYRTDLPVPGGF